MYLLCNENKLTELVNIFFLWEIFTFCSSDVANGRTSGRVIHQWPNEEKCQPLCSLEGNSFGGPFFQAIWNGSRWMPPHTLYALSTCPSSVFPLSCVTRRMCQMEIQPKGLSTPGAVNLLEQNLDIFFFYHKAGTNSNGYSEYWDGNLFYGDPCRVCLEIT